ncbi:MAG TPA: hypothetical protein VHV51_19740 [Polyangiaceae bacterium]|jgi:hypothetical protein|nr:hypothetical protein [Polyangiaceae bacterium]
MAKCSISVFGRRTALLALFGSVSFMVSTLPKIESNARAAERVVLAVFVSKDSNVQDMKMSELRRVFTNADDSAFSGTRSIPFNHTAHSTDRVGFDQTVLHMNPDEVSRFWIDRKIRGLPGPPRAVDSLSQLLHLVARNTGGIGYARPAQVTNEVRIIRIDGRLPNEGGYPLQFSE